VKYQYVWSLAGVNELVLRDEYSGGSLSQRLYVEQDANGDVTSLTDTSGNPVARFVYDPYGNVTFLNAAGTAPATPVSWDYLFQGGRQDPVTDRVSFGARDYIPFEGKWAQRDPLGLGAGDNNIYEFVGGNPATLNDPTGLFSDPVNDFFDGRHSGSLMPGNIVGFNNNPSPPHKPAPPPIGPTPPKPRDPGDDGLGAGRSLGNNPGGEDNGPEDPPGAAEEGPGGGEPEPDNPSGGTGTGGDSEGDGAGGWGGTLSGAMSSLGSLASSAGQFAYDNTVGAVTGLASDAATVWGNTSDYGLAGRLYVTGGTMAATLTGVRGVSEAYVGQDAVSARNLSGGERVFRGRLNWRSRCSF
jgi:RHS repeat-associated protein